VASYTEFMGYTQPWYSVRDADEPAAGSFALLDMTPYGRGEAWQASPDGWPEGHDPCWYALARCLSGHVPDASIWLIVYNKCSI
jgi:hypothetical protein